MSINIRNSASLCLPKQCSVIQTPRRALGAGAVFHVQIKSSTDVTRSIPATQGANRTIHIHPDKTFICFRARHRSLIGSINQFDRPIVCSGMFTFCGGGGLGTGTAKGLSYTNNDRLPLQTAQLGHTAKSGWCYAVRINCRKERRQ